MSFLDKIGKAMQYANQKSDEKMERIEYYKMKYENYDDERLIKQFKNCSGDAKIACTILLRERGYGNN